MPVDFEAIFNKYNIPTAQSGRHKRHGYSNVTCCYCHGNTGNHLGFCHETGTCVCFRCSSKYAPKALADVLKIDIDKAKQLISDHTTGFLKLSFEGFKSEVDTVDIKKLNLRPLIKFHREYLENRGFNVNRLIHFFDLKSTGYETDPFYFKNKIFVPYYLNRELITYTTRDVSVDTKQSGMRAKYVTCKKTEGLLPPNHFVYNYDNIKHRKKMRTLFFEGPMDTFKFPMCSGALSGIKFTSSQVKFIVDNFDHPVFLLDQDEAGDIASQKAFDEIEILTGNPPEIYELDGSLKNPDGSVKDPGDMTYEEADELLKILDIKP